MRMTFGQGSQKGSHGSIIVGSEFLGSAIVRQSNTDRRGPPESHSSVFASLPANDLGALEPAACRTLRSTKFLRGGTLRTHV